MGAEDSLFQFLMPVKLGCFATIFLGVFFYARELKFAAWTAIAYFSGMIASLIEILHGGLYLGPFHFLDLTNAFFGFVSIAIVIAMAERYKSKIPWPSILLLTSIGIVCQIYWGHIDPNLKGRTITFEIVAGALMALTIPIIWRNRKHWIDKVILWLFVGISASYFARLTSVFFYFDQDFIESTSEAPQYMLLLYFVNSIVAMASAIALLAATAMDMMEKYRRDSMLDSLTGLLNRRGFQNAYESVELIHDKRHSTRFLLVFDLDYFKSINDEFGHPVGDAVLVRIGTIFRDLTKSFGQAARCGGEEFAILLNINDIKTAKVVVEHLALSISMTIHPELPEGRKVTASFGLAKVKANGSIDQAIQLADQALYRAKDTGRNRIEFAKNISRDSIAA